MREKKWERDGVVAKHMMAPVDRGDLNTIAAAVVNISLRALPCTRHCAKHFRLSQNKPMRQVIVLVLFHK